MRVEIVVDAGVEIKVPSQVKIEMADSLRGAGKIDGTMDRVREEAQSEWPTPVAKPQVGSAPQLTYDETDEKQKKAAGAAMAKAAAAAAGAVAHATGIVAKHLGTVRAVAKEYPDRLFRVAVIVDKPTAVMVQAGGGKSAISKRVRSAQARRTLKHLKAIERLERTVPTRKLDAFGRALERVPKSAKLTIEQVKDIARGDLTLDVVEPQAYSTVTELSAENPMFSDSVDGSDTGLFVSSPTDPKIACSSRQCDDWWVVGNPLERHLRGFISGVWGK